MVNEAVESHDKGDTRIAWRRRQNHMTNEAAELVILAYPRPRRISFPRAPLPQLARKQPLSSSPPGAPQDMWFFCSYELSLFRWTALRPYRIGSIQIVIYSVVAYMREHLKCKLDWFLCNSLIVPWYSMIYCPCHKPWYILYFYQRFICAYACNLLFKWHTISIQRCCCVYLNTFSKFNNFNFIIRLTVSASLIVSIWSITI